MKRIILSIVLMLVLCMPLTAAMATGSVAVNGVSLADGSYLKNGDNTVYTGELPESGYAHYKGGLLTLNNFTGKRIRIENKEDLTIQLIGSNRLNRFTNDVIYAKNTDLTITGEGDSLTIKAEENGIDIDNGSLSILNCSLTITSEENDCIEMDDENNEGNLLIQNSTLDLTSENDEGLDIDDGWVKILNSTLIIDAHDDGIEAGGGELSVSGSTLDVSSSTEEGITTEKLTIENSDVKSNAEYAALYSETTMSLTGSNLRLMTRDTEYPVVCAYDGLHAPGMPVIRIEQGEHWYASDSFYTIGDENGPFSSYVFNAPSAVKPPRTGDSTPIALLAALCMLSLTGAFLLRKRSA